MISIIIPSLNSPHIKKIVKIIKGQRPENTELIIVGKDSAGLLKGEADINFIDTGSAVSPARSRNIGLKNARGTIIIFLDSDCIPHKGWLDGFIRCCCREKEIVGGAIDFGRGNFWQLSDNIIHFYNSHPSRKGDIITDGPLPTANLCLSRKVIDEVGFFSEGLVTGEDFEYSMRMRERGYTLHFENTAKVFHLTGRDTFLKVIRHSRSWAINSIRIRNRFSRLLKTPFFMRNGILLWLFSPVIAALATFKIFFISKGLLKYWFSFPVIYIVKLAWSITAAGELLNAE